MQRILKYLIFFVPFIAFTSALNALRDVYYYNSERQVIKVYCHHGEERQSWNSNRRIFWFTNENKNEKLYDSSIGLSQEKFPFAEKTQDNNTVFLRNNNGKGWAGYGCETSGADGPISGNIISNIPYFYGPNFRHEPRAFQLNTTYTLWCDGGASPNETMTITFWLNDTAIATVKDRYLTDLKAVKDLKIAHNFDAMNNSIFVIPSLAEHRGFYGCNLTYPGSNMNLVMKSGNWSTNSGFSVPALSYSLLISLWMTIAVFGTIFQ